LTDQALNNNRKLVLRIQSENIAISIAMTLPLNVKENG
jgi:hypothetical protein